MKKETFLLALFLTTIGCKSSQKNAPGIDNTMEKEPWNKKELLFEYAGSENWEQKWFLDGIRAKVTPGEDGMLLAAGKEYKNDTCHAVLWTKETFDGNILIEYDYTREDTSRHGVNIIYFMATGKGDAEYPKDVYDWREYRNVPTMSKYFRNMNTYHISYSTGNIQNTGKDYLRLRRYNPALQRLKGSEVSPDYFNTGLFTPGITYKIKISKYYNEIIMKVTPAEDEGNKKVFRWDVSSTLACTEGRIGLRHMYTRSSRYKNFKVWRIE